MIETGSQPFAVSKDLILSSFHRADIDSVNRFFWIHEIMLHDKMKFPEDRRIYNPKALPKNKQNGSCSTGIKVGFPYQGRYLKKETSKHCKNMRKLHLKSVRCSLFANEEKFGTMSM